MNSEPSPSPSPPSATPSCQESLLHREAPSGYLDEWNQALAEMRDEEIEETISVLVFRLYDEWLALPTSAFAEVIDRRPVHRIPHRSNQTLLGLTNVRGTLNLCFSLAHMLGIQPLAADGRSMSRRAYQRFVVIKQEGDHWVFPAEEVFGIHPLPEEKMEEAPVTVAISRQPFTKSIFRFRGRTIGLLDEELIFYKLTKDVL